MGMACFPDETAQSRGVYRWGGYGVKAPCDDPSCHAQVNRGPDFLCRGCGLAFCDEHRGETCDHEGVTPKPDTVEWVRHMLLSDGWKSWRAANTDRVISLWETYGERMNGAPTTPISVLRDQVTNP